MNKQTGLISEGKLNEVLIINTVRPDGSLRIQQDFSNCVTLTEQHGGQDTDINYLIKRYKPDELAAYISARNFNKREIIGHDFSSEPDLQGAKNITLKLKKDYEALPEEIKINFKDHVDFLKFIDNPQNQAKMLKLGLMTKKEIQIITKPLNDNSNDDKPKSDSTPPLKSEAKS